MAKRHGEWQPTVELVTSPVVFGFRSSLALIAAIGALVTAHPAAVDIARFGGAAFLIGYGVLAARRAARPSALTPSEEGPAHLALG